MDQILVRSADGKNRSMTGEPFAKNILGADMILKSILVASYVTLRSRGLFAAIIAGLVIENRNLISVIGVSVRSANNLFQKERN